MADRTTSRLSTSTIKEPSWDEFGRLLTTYAGWGMRVTFVPDDRVHENPEVDVREPKDRKRPNRRR